MITTPATWLLNWAISLGASPSVAALVVRPSGTSAVAQIASAIGALQLEARTAPPTRAWALEAASRILLAVLAVLEST